MAEKLPAREAGGRATTEWPPASFERYHEWQQSVGRQQIHLPDMSCACTSHQSLGILIARYSWLRPSRPYMLPRQADIVKKGQVISQWIPGEEGITQNATCMLSVMQVHCQADDGNTCQIPPRTTFSTANMATSSYCSQPSKPAGRRVAGAYQQEPWNRHGDYGCQGRLLCAPGPG